MKIRDEYTKHKHLSTLQDKYMSYVPEKITEEGLWQGAPVETEGSDSSSKSNAEVIEIVEKYGL